MKRIYFILLFLITNFFISAQVKIGADYKEEYLKAQAYCDSLRNSNDKYFGIGTAKIENGDVGAAIPIAKDRARAELAKSIKVRVTKVFQRNITSKTKNENEDVQRIIDEKINVLTKTYTDLLLENVHESSPFLNYPAPRNVTIAVFIDKEEYQNSVEKDINGRKLMILGSIHNGMQKLNSGHFTEGIKDLIQANNYLNRFFEGLPITEDIEGNNIPRNLNTYINGKVTDFFSSINFVPLFNNLVFNVQGEINQTPVILIQYTKTNGEKTAATRLPLLINFIEGNGEVRQKDFTNLSGKVSLKIRKVNPVLKSAVIRISVDKNEFPELENFPNLDMPFFDISLTKMKTIALAVAFTNNGKVSELLQLSNTIKSKLLKHNLQIVPVTIFHEKLNEKDKQKIINTNADYFLQLFLKSSGASTLGGYNNMWISNSTGTISIYELPQIDLKEMEQLPVKKGYGTSPINAGRDGVNQLTGNILTKIIYFIELIN